MMKGAGFVLTFTLFFCATSFGQAKSGEATLVISNVTVIDATGQPAMPDMTVIVVGDRITRIGKSAEVQIPRKARVVDGKGKFLIPGLWDMHGHLSNAGEGVFAALIANGIANVRDLGGSTESERVTTAPTHVSIRLVA